MTVKDKNEWTNLRKGNTGALGFLAGTMLVVATCPCAIVYPSPTRLGSTGSQGSQFQFLLSIFRASSASFDGPPDDWHRFHFYSEWWTYKFLPSRCSHLSVGQAESGKSMYQWLSRAVIRSHTGEPQASFVLFVYFFLLMFWFIVCPTFSPTFLTLLLLRPHHFFISWT